MLPLNVVQASGALRPTVRLFAKPGSPGREICARRPHEAMKMVVHKDVSVKHNPRHLQVVRQLAEEALAVLVAPEDLRAAVAASGDMIERVREINAWWTWHGTRSPKRNPGCKTESTKSKPDPAFLKLRKRKLK